MYNVNNLHGRADEGERAGWVIQYLLNLLTNHKLNMIVNIYIYVNILWSFTTGIEHRELRPFSTRQHPKVNCI